MRVASILLLMFLIVVEGASFVRAAGENFSLSAFPGRIFEGNPAGVSLTLGVSNAQVGVTYMFSWTVTDPSGKIFTASNTTLSLTSSWSEIANYPRNFGASLLLVGNYTVSVTETLPSSNPNVARTSFQVGLTDSSVYSRDSVVTISGSGYNSAERVTISLVQGGVPASGFPLQTNSTSGGTVSLLWQTLLNTPLGVYNLSLTGTVTPPKTPPDSQLFTVNPLGTTANTILTGPSTVVRSQAVEIRFNVTYVNGAPTLTGTSQLLLTEPSNVGSFIVTASYNATQGSFTGYYRSTLSSPTGLWTVDLSKNSIDDGYGNRGPTSTLSSSFSVQPAALTVDLQQNTSPLSAGNTLSISAKVLAPDGSNFTQGTVMATLTDGGQTVAAPLSLVFDQTKGQWTGSYVVRQGDPSGTWLLTINARDGYGNSGQTTTTFQVNSAGPQGPFSLVLTWAWLIAILGALGLGFAILIFRSRKGIHREVKLDLQAIHRKAEEVKSDDFLQSIQAQLKRRMERVGQDKEKKND